jgi:protein-S-isoprenylcysteine O-methyltransferase Ste14
MPQTSLASSAAKPVALAGFAVAVLAIAIMALRGEIFAQHWPLIAVQAGAVALMIWARLTFGLRSFNAGAAPTAGELVTTGPYRFWRHPIYAAVILFAIAAALSHQTASAFACTAAIIGGMSLRMRSEEQFLSENYPGYRSYAAKTARILPGIFTWILLLARLR